ncbi:hypothetical protein GR158_16940 [Shinella sp. AETb1-6]|nr:hypothetical protein [Shinella sp. AETb1-6]
MTQELDMARLEAMTTEVQFADVVAATPRFLESKVRGRILVPVNLQLG